MPETTTQLPAIRGLQPSTLIDWPGRVASILFLPGCNLRCPYCHAADLLNPAGGEVIPFDQVRRFLAEKRGWIEAEWGISELGRRAKVYRLTTRGPQQLRTETAQWSSFQEAVSRILLSPTPTRTTA